MNMNKKWKLSTPSKEKMDAQSKFKPKFLNCLSEDSSYFKSFGIPEDLKEIIRITTPRSSSLKILSSFILSDSYDYLYNGDHRTENIIFLNSYLFKKIFGQYLIYTDKKSKNLINKWSSKDVEINCSLNMKNYPNKLWCAPKIESMRQQKDNFIHVDTDIFPWSEEWTEFSSDFLFYSIDLKVGTNPSTPNNIFSYYEHGIKKLRSIKNFEILNDINIKKTIDFDIYNFGIVGCNNLQLLSIYFNELEKFLVYKKDIDRIFRSYFDIVSLCVTLEQLLLSKIIHEYGFSVSTVYKDIGSGMKIPTGKQKIPMSHLMGRKKDIGCISHTKAMINFIKENDISLTKPN